MSASSTLFPLCQSARDILAGRCEECGCNLTAEADGTLTNSLNEPFCVVDGTQVPHQLEVTYDTRVLALAS